MVQRHQQGLTRAERRFLLRVVIFAVIGAILWVLFSPGT